MLKSTDTRTVLFIFRNHLVTPHGTWDLSSRPGIKPVPPELGAGRLNHCPAREVQWHLENQWEQDDFGKPHTWNDMHEDFHYLGRSLGPRCQGWGAREKWGNNKLIHQLEPMIKFWASLERCGFRKESSIFVKNFKRLYSRTEGEM